MEQISAFGDSVLKGVILENNKYKVTQNRFSNTCEETFGIEIENKAKFGSTILHGEKTIEKNLDLIRESSSKYVIMEFGGNDCDFNWKEVSENPNIEHLPNSTISDFINIYTQLIKEVKEMQKIPVRLSLPPIDSKKYIKRISNNLNEENILKWMNGNVQFLSNWHERYNIELFKLALNNNIQIIDITSKFLEEKDYGKYLCDDGIHPNEEGHKLIARAIKEHINRRNIRFD